MYAILFALASSALAAKTDYSDIQISELQKVKSVQISNSELASALSTAGGVQISNGKMTAKSGYWIAKTARDYLIVGAGSKPDIHSMMSVTYTLEDGTSITLRCDCSSKNDDCTMKQDEQTGGIICYSPGGACNCELSTEITPGSFSF